MAPSEFDLRAALRDGEGEGLNADRLMMIGDAYSDQRKQRRVRLLSAAAVIALVTTAGVGLSQVGGNGESGGGGAVANEAGGQAAGIDQLHGAQSSANYGALASVPARPKTEDKALASVSCPRFAPDYRLPAHGEPSGYARTRLFGSSVASVVICAYGPSLTAASAPPDYPARLTLSGIQAARLALSLETAPKVAPNAVCASVSTRQYAVIGVDQSGSQLEPVSAKLPSTACGAVVTNGIAVRYNWQPPPDVARKLERLTPTGPPDSTAASPTPTS